MLARARGLSWARPSPAHATHFLLMTATPYKGDPESCRLLVNLRNFQWARRPAMHRPDGGKL